MSTLELVRKNQVMAAVILTAINAGLSVTSFDGRSVTVKAGCLPVYISWEMCDCHGGRMWLSQDETSTFIELSSDEYDSGKGIEDPETELAYYIDNEMVDRVKGFERYVYVVTKTGEFRDGEKKVRYFDSVEKASRFIFEEPGHDVMCEYGTVVHQYPNSDFQTRYTFDREEGGRIYFKAEKLERARGTDAPHEVVREYEIEFRVFRKGVK